MPPTPLLRPRSVLTDVWQKRLDQGIADYQAAHPDAGDTFSVTWAPFYLLPNAPNVEKIEHFHEKFGPQRTQMIQDRMIGIGHDVGINFSFGGRMGNTVGALQAPKFHLPLAQISSQDARADMAWHSVTRIA